MTRIVVAFLLALSQPACGVFIEDECNQDSACDDANPCTLDQCSDGECQNTALNDGAGCEDGTACTIDDTCRAGVCAAGPQKDCSPQDGPCASGTCNEQTGQCEATFWTDGTDCDDGDWCTVDGTCLQGVCQGQDRDCDDGDDCTLDSCVLGADQCTHTLQPNPGAEGQAVAGSCTNGLDDDCDGATDGQDTDCVLCEQDGDCDDSNPCTEDTCDLQAQACTNEVLADNTGCDDGDWCTLNDACLSGTCQGEARCDDDDPCTQDLCDDQAQSCANQLQENPGAERLDLPDTCTNGLDDDCDRLVDEADPDCIECTGQPGECDDGNACTDDSCELMGNYCVHQPVQDGTPCDDARVCTVADACNAGACTGLPNACDDNDPCTLDTCDPLDDQCEHLLSPQPHVHDICGNGVDEDCDGVTDGCCLGEGEFVSGPVLAAANLGEAFTVGDFDADGIPDVAGVSFGTDQLFVFLGQGSDGVSDGAYAAGVSYPTGSAPQDVVSADFNNDGILDLAVACRLANQVDVFAGLGADGRGDGTFGPAVSFTIGTGVWRLQTRDFDADGNLDLIVPLRGQAELHVLLGTGEPTLSAASFGSALVSATVANPMGLALGDFNADGILDAAVGRDSGREVWIHLGQGADGRGDGTFVFLASHNAAPSTADVQDLETADLNADGILDLVAVDRSNDALAVFTGAGTDGRGNGSFGTAQVLTVGNQPTDVTVGDLNHDRLPDLVVSNIAGDTVGIFINTTQPPAADPSFAVMTSMPTGDAPTKLGLADLDQDGILDLLVGRYDLAGDQGTVEIYFGAGSGARGAGGWIDRGSHDLTTQALDGVALDVDADGIQDLLVSGGPGGLVLLPGLGADGRGHADFGAPQTINADVSPRGLAIGDFDADAIADVALLDYQANSLEILLAGGSDAIPDGTFAAPYTVPNSGADGPMFMLASDLDTDRILDLVHADQFGGDVLVCLGVGDSGVGDGTFAAGVPYQANTSTIVPATGDFNADGVPDLAVTAYTANRVSVLLGVGDGSFAPKTDYLVGMGPWGASTGDFDADGILDLAVGNHGDGTLSLLFGNGTNGRGDGTFAEAVSVTIGAISSSGVVRTADWNGDGILDLAVGHPDPSSASISLLLGDGQDGRGDGTFTLLQNVPLGSSPDFLELTVGDYNSDGLPDLAVIRNAQGDGVVDVLTANRVCLPRR